MSKKLLFTIATVILFSIVLSSCGSASTGAGYTEKLIAGFETQLEVDSITPFTDSGAKIQLNKDKAYLSQGNASMFVELYGADKQSLPTFISDNRFVFYVKAGDFITRSQDFSNVMSVAVDIYNDSDFDLSVYLDIITESGSVLQLDKIPLIKGRMNFCVFEIDFLTAEYLGISKVENIHLKFGHVSPEQTSAKLYIDNFRTRDYKTMPTDKLAVPTLAENEVCFFESDYIFKTLTKEGIDTNTRNVNIAKNINPDFVKQGNASLKITRNPLIQQTQEGWRGYTYLHFPSAYISAIDLSNYDKEKYKLVIDVYNDYDYTTDINLKLTSSSGYIDGISYLQPKEWKTIEFMLNAETNQRIPFDWRSMSGMSFMLHEHYGAKDAVIYVDNFRVEAV